MINEIIYYNVGRTPISTYPIEWCKEYADFIRSNLESRGYDVKVIQDQEFKPAFYVYVYPKIPEGVHLQIIESLDTHDFDKEFQIDVRSKEHITQNLLRKQYHQEKRTKWNKSTTHD